MQWSKGNPQTSRAVVQKGNTERAVLDFIPPRFDLGTPTQALEYLKEKVSGSGFRMNESVRIQTGVDKIEASDLEERIEVAALEKLKEIQESAYKEAYDLGRADGHNDAFTKAAGEIKQSMEHLNTLLNAIGNLKKEMQSQNEAHLIKLVFQIATRLAKSELKTDSMALAQIIKDAVNLSQDEENVRVRVAPEQFDFLEQLKKQTGREFEFMKKITIDSSPDVTPGGCIVETNYGEVDARIEQRIDQLWAAFSESIPKVKDKIAG